MKIFDTPPWVDKCHLFVRLPLGTPSKNKYNKLGGGGLVGQNVTLYKVVFNSLGAESVQNFGFF